MPLYEYECEPQGHRFERIQKFSDPPIATCPVCGGPVRKLLSSPAIQFKGTGWYITDYAKKASGGASGGKSGSSEGTSAKTDGASTSDSSASSATSAKPAETKKADTKKD